MYLITFYNFYQLANVSKKYKSSENYAWGTSLWEESAKREKLPCREIFLQSWTFWNFSVTDFVKLL